MIKTVVFSGDLVEVSETVSIEKSAFEKLKAGGFYDESNNCIKPDSEHAKYFNHRDEVNKNWENDRPIYID